ncbi:FecR family protein [Bacteroides pyogenes]|uniref:DUF4974 domain-containing protein n=1 Tax=Bacteroides pyogenes TaxID=310300 RepID=A0A5D3FVM4_9BACE|nr:FecR family protein [Bacteroides pyogenes]MBR8704474.1 hypothetical protein [Bacteroides pyogenes]TYK35230.1 DUF4974 domain-containing protein [Bacteroides pyogenes]TYK42000.1 DUF4974 domain-containing protein [Bacteroides pyogenes]TYK51956.1 DUF4974 domain-containing protein [Bacteroides pyogenes]
MKDYVQKIIRAFAASRHDRKLTAEIHRWLVDETHADEKEAALHDLWKETEATKDASTRASLSKVYERLGVNERHATASNTFSMRRFRWYAAAAVVLLAVSISGTFFLTKNMYSEIAMVEQFTPAGDMEVIELPDGSTVQTNSGTLLLYPEAFKGNTRTVYLIGEANFKVKKNPDQPFIVKSGTMAVTALGTEFNVFAYPENEKMIATLIHGKVKVDCNNGAESYILNPAEQVVYYSSTKQSTLARADLEDVTAWQRGMFVFRGCTVKEVLSTLERRYAVTFQYNASSFNNDRYNFRFREKSDIGDIMAIIREVVGGFTYKMEGDTCYIKSHKRK